MRATTISPLTLSCCALGSTSAGGVVDSDSLSASIVVGSWDHSLYLYSPVFGRVTSTVLAHDDAVSCVATAPAGSGGGSGAAARWSHARVLSGSWDAQVKLWTCTADEFLPESEQVRSSCPCRGLVQPRRRRRRCRCRCRCFFSRASLFVARARTHARTHTHTPPSSFVNTQSKCRPLRSRELILFTVTLCANPANDLTCPPSYIIIKIPTPSSPQHSSRSRWRGAGGTTAARRPLRIPRCLWT